MVSSLGFGAAMFGRRPIPQPAMQYAGSHPGAVMAPSSAGGGRGAAAGDGTVPDDRTAAMQVTIPALVRVRSGALLALGVISIAALMGVVLSIVVVGLVMLIS